MTLRLRDHPPGSLLLLRVPSRQALARPLFRAHELDLPGFWSSSRLDQSASTHRGASHFPTTVRPRAFATPRRFTPRSGLQACFIPLPRPGFLSFRVFSPRAATLPHREEPAPLPSFIQSSPTEIGCHSGRPRLRGFDPREDAFARLSYSPHRASLPSSSFVSSRRSLFSSCSTAYPSCFALDVTARVLRLRARR